ncbi:MAG: hypothetical protein IKA17_06925 [Clostridia bacterium]|nr:hypothetical protein [Clostridia bacterium]
MKKIKNLLMILICSVVILSMSIASVLSADKGISYSERRELKQFSSLGETSILSSEFSKEVEKYLLDQMPLREGLRMLDSRIRLNVLMQSDANGLWAYKDQILKNDQPLNEKQVAYGINLMNRLIKTNLQNANVFYSVIPEKTYYVRDKFKHLKFDYNKLENLLKNGVEGASYIDIKDTLELSDYYLTDTHWSQDKLFETVDKIAKSMGSDAFIIPETEYEKHTLDPFYGVYWSQAAIGEKPDKLCYLTSDYTENAKVYGIDPEVLKNQFGVNDTLEKKVYATDRFGKMDSYDVFLSGAQPLVTIECENAKTDKELIIFRDSFSSSIAPLFAGAYKKVTLIDLRYMPSMLLKQFVEFKAGQDVLFLYSASLYNSSMLLK